MLELTRTEGVTSLILSIWQLQAGNLKYLILTY